MAFNLTMKSKTAEATLSLSTEYLSRFITIVKPVMSRRTAVPILRFVRMCSVDGKGFLRVTDSDIFAEMLFSFNGTGNIDVAIEYTALENLVEKSPKGVFLIEREGLKLNFKMNLNVCGSIGGVDGRQCPTLENNEVAYSEIQMSEFDNFFVNKYLAPLCKFDAEYDTLYGILVEVGPEGNGFITTDRNMLVCTRWVTPSNRNTLPSVAFKMATEYGQPSSIMLYSNGYSMELGTFRIYGKYIAGIYPDIHRLMYSEVDHELKVDVGAFRTDLKRLLSTTEHYKNGICPVMLTFGEEYLGVSSVTENYEYGKTGIKMDGERILELLDRFDDNSKVTFKSSPDSKKPTLWIDNKATTMFMCLAG